MMSEAPFIPMNPADTERWLALSQKIEDHYQAGEFDKVDEILKAVDLAAASTQDIVGYVMTTFRAREKLLYRKTFVAAAEQELMKRPEWKREAFIRDFRMIARSE